MLTPRVAARSLSEAIGQGQRAALLFGGERAGLETADIALCQAVVTLPVDARFRSLNLAQAVAITAYEWRMAVAPEAPQAFRAGPPSWVSGPAAGAPGAAPSWRRRG